MPWVGPAVPPTPAQPATEEPSTLFPEHLEGFWQERHVFAPLQIRRAAGCWNSNSRNIWGGQEWVSVFFPNVLATLTYFTGQHLSHETAVLCLEQRETALAGLPKRPPLQPCSPCSFLCGAQLRS